MGRRRLALAGQRFGRLLVLAEAADYAGMSQWRCRCDCGAEKVARGSSLTKGYTRSCGCLRREVSANGARARARRGALATNAALKAGRLGRLDASAGDVEAPRTLQVDARQMDALAAAFGLRAVAVPVGRVHRLADE